MNEITKEDYANVFGSFMETALDCTEQMHNELEEKDKEIERLNKCIKDDKENADEIIAEQQKEIERLNNIINELEKWLEEDLKQVYRDAGHRHNLILEVLDKLHELKGSDKE